MAYFAEILRFSLCGQHGPFLHKGLKVRSSLELKLEKSKDLNCGCLKMWSSRLFWYRGSSFSIEELVAGGAAESRFARFPFFGARLPTLLILRVVDQWQLTGFAFAVGNRLHVSISASCLLRRSRLR